MERKLAAILAADVAGYSRLMEADEEGTLAALRGHREVVDGLIAAHRGRVFNTAGDSVIAEFASAVEATLCAVEIQQELARRNEPVPKAKRLEFRIGINIGDVMVEGGNLFGDGVNVADRVQKLAEPGGICIARNVQDHLRNKADLRLEPMGEHRVKNIADPVMVYRVLTGAAAARPAAIVWLANLRYRPRAMRALAVALLLIGGAAIAVYLYPHRETTDGPPTIAILPFVNLTGDPSQDAFCDGLTDTVTTVLSTYPEIRVTARTSSEQFKDTTLDVREIAKRLNVRYVVEGSVQRSADAVRITTQLIDGATGDHIWARPIDVTGANSISLQQTAATTIYAALAGFGGEFRRREEELVWSKPESKLSEYDYYLRGHQVFFRFTKDDMALARQIWRDGLRKFPNSPLLRIKIAVSHWQDVVWGWSADPSLDLDQGWALMQEAAAMPNKPRLAEWYTHNLMAFYLEWHERDYARAVAEARKTVTMTPYDAFILADLSEVLALAGNKDEAIEWGQKALMLDPHPSDMYLSKLGAAHYLAGQQVPALQTLQKLSDPTNLYLAAVFARLGRVEEARATMAAYMRAYPSDSIAVQALWPVKDPAVLQAYLDDLRKAGMPEK